MLLPPTVKQCKCTVGLHAVGILLLSAFIIVVVQIPVLGTSSDFVRVSSQIGIIERS